MYNAISLFSGDKLGIVVATDVDFYTVILICTMLLVQACSVIRVKSIKTFYCTHTGNILLC